MVHEKYIDISDTGFIVFEEYDTGEGGGIARVLQE